MFMKRIILKEDSKLLLTVSLDMKSFMIINHIKLQRKIEKFCFLLKLVLFSIATHNL